MSLVPGSRLGPYEIVSLLGAGGMGEVWRARDTRLGREVAVKVLSAHVADDPKALGRFEREARAVASLSHPNVLALHDFGREDGVVYTVTELLEGETLRERLRQGPLPPRKVAEWGAQIARGLAAAHDKGIVHRDLKPENLFLARDGHVTVLDFGVALYEAPVPTEDTEAPTLHVRTEAGRVLGTMGYMAPEQLCGEPVDARTDLFALGCVLYEMLAGERPFHRSSVAETVVAVLREEPEDLDTVLGPTGRRVPPTLARLVRHCLEKVPEERFQSARDLAFQLEALAAEASGTGPTAIVPVLRRRAPASRRVIVAAFALGVVLGGLGGYWLGSRRQIPPIRLRVLTHSGNDSWPTASPDGKLVAFASDRDGRSRIWLRQMSSGDEVAVTAGVDVAPRFSPDGTSLLFVRRREDGSDLFRVAAVGGEAKRLVPDAVGGDWSPDGRHIAFVRGLSRTRWLVGVAASNGGEERQVSGEYPLPLGQPKWSPDGRWVATPRRASLAGTPDSVLLLDVRGGGEQVLRLPGVGAISALGWTGTDTLLLAVPEGAAARTPSSRLVAYEVGRERQRTLLWIPYVVPSLDVLSAGSVVITAVVPRQNLRQLPLAGASPSTGDQGHWLSRGTSVDRQPVYAPAGDRVVFSSSRGGNLDLWSMSLADRSIHRLTDDPAEDWDPAFTPDGRHLLWSSDRGGHFEVWAAEADGRAARQLSSDGRDAENPTANASGWVFYSSGAAGKRGIWRLGLDGHGARLLVPGVTAHPEVSPDGHYVLYHVPVEEREEIRVARAADGSPVPFRIAIPFRNLPVSFGLSALPVAPGRARWRPDGKAIVYVGLMPDGRFAVFEQPFAPGSDTDGERRVVALSEGGLITESLGLAPDGRHLLVSFIERTPNLVVVEGVPRLPAPARGGG